MTDAKITLSASHGPIETLQQRLNQLRSDQNDLDVTISVLNSTGEAVSESYGTYEKISPCP